MIDKMRSVAYKQDEYATPPPVQSLFGDCNAPAFISGCTTNTLTWKGVPGARSYHLYRYESSWASVTYDGTTPINLDDSVPFRPFFNDATALPGHTYYYAVASVDRDGHESAN